MRPDQARELVTVLCAAYPRQAVPDATFALYVAEVATLADVDAARAAFIDLIRSQPWWPSIAELRDVYQRAARWQAARRAEELGIEEESRQPPLDLAENARRAQALLERIGKATPTLDAPRRHTDEELATAYARARRAKDEAERRRAALVEPTNENGEVA
jgi:hypothetical protein